MPPVMFLALIGAAGIAGYRIVSNLLEGSKSSGRKQANGMRRATAPARDLGKLEWDEDAGVYRPSPKRER
ncbi:hypothetical protein HYPDE_37868 [Hyphomicrobium denitrificans 1NES1]|uniref:Uncharacterized protein n=1 Tax=Hyphomicrobium denitrificans 1NES1 TaxID=670307 RepID=N0BGH4_9HYPH|nr:hypothetical protein [Hyphomicrobium denitrificans]AGK59245.1 hypothetical protein HYPDE_37868 [Hyphomicrobium denitrificans 1NES1]